MSPEDPNFIAAIIAQPDRDLPRLCYADWLEDTDGMAPCPQCAGRGRVRPAEFRNGYQWNAGDLCPTCHGTGEVSNGHAERSEFIRVQCELAQLIGDGLRCPVCDWPIREDGSGCQPDNCSFRPSEHTSEHARWLPRQKHFHALRHRERELWIALPKSAWNVPGENHVFNTVPEFSTTVGTFRVHRGFVESLACRWLNWRTHADAIRATPLRKVRLMDWPRAVAGGSPNPNAVMRRLDGMPWLTMPAVLTLHDDTVALMLKCYWPAIEFELPQQHQSR